MRLTIKNFRCYVNSTFEFHKNKIILVDGNSGTGKSTIFDAICWCLYKKIPGDKSMKINPWGSNSKTKTSVEMTTDEVTVCRATQPNTLKVIINRADSSEKNEDIRTKYFGSSLKGGDKLEGFSAQSYINEWLGSSDYWLATSYMVQDELNPLLFGSASVKTELIGRLCFDQDDPELFIEKAKSQSKRLESVHESMVKKFNQQVLELKSRMERDDVKGTELEEDIVIDRQHLENLNDKNEVRKAEKVRFETLIEQRNKLRDSLNKEWKDKNVESHIEELENIVRDWEKYNKWDSEKKYYNLITDELDGVELELKKYDPEEESIEGELFPSQVILSVRKKEELRNHYSQTCKKMEIEYQPDVMGETEKALRDRSREARDDIQNNTMREKYAKQIDELRKQIKELKLVDPPQTSPETAREDMEKLKGKLEEAKELHKVRLSELEQLVRKEVIKCPHCSGVVIYQHGVLEKMPQVDKEEIKKEISDLKKEKTKITEEVGQKLDNKRRELDFSVKNAKKYEKAQITVRAIEEQIENMKIPDFIENEDIECVDMMESIYYTLKNIEWIEEPEISSEKMEKHNGRCKLLELRNKKKKLEENLEKRVEENLKRPPITKKEAMLRLKRAQGALSKKKELNNYGKDIDKKKEEAEREIGKLKEEIRKEMKKLEHLRVLKSVIEQRDRLFVLKSEIDEKWEEVDKCARLVDYMIESEFQVYQYACDLVNQNLIGIVKDLYTVPIHVEIRTTKITSNKREKPSINIYITYNGMEVNPKDFSGGEKERLSLAMTLSLMKLSSSPIIILDETFSPLSEEDREMAIKVILEHAKRYDLVTLCVGHGSVTGWYDQVMYCKKDCLNNVISPPEESEEDAKEVKLNEDLIEYVKNMKI
jgi:exonuclease SbcC